MPLLKQAYLKNAREPLQIRYPADFVGEKYATNEDADDLEFYISTEPRFLTENEIDLVNDYLKSLNYPQQLLFTGCVMLDTDDPLLGFDHDQLDKLEKEQNLPSTRKPVSGGTRQTFERVLLIRERGFAGNGFKSLPVARR